MKNIVIPIDHLVMLAELDDKEAGQIAIQQWCTQSYLLFVSLQYRSSTRIFCKTQRNQHDKCNEQEVGYKKENYQEVNFHR